MEGVSMRQAFDVYKRFAIKAKSTGDTMGRKMMMSPVGAGDIDFDFVYSFDHLATKWLRAWICC